MNPSYLWKVANLLTLSREPDNIYTLFTQHILTCFHPKLVVLYVGNFCSLMLKSILISFEIRTNNSHKVICSMQKIQRGQKKTNKYLSFLCDLDRTY